MKIICIGRNYLDHATELGNPVPSEPMFFLKPDSSVLHKRHAFYIPDWTKEVHYEVELVVKILKLGKAIQTRYASRYYAEVGLGIDFTARDVQSKLKAAGHPWEKAKGFDGSASCLRRIYFIGSFGQKYSEPTVRFKHQRNESASGVNLGDDFQSR